MVTKKLQKKHTKLSDHDVEIVLDLLNLGFDTKDIEKKTGYRKMQIAAVKAHITMGTYT